MKKQTMYNRLQKQYEKLNQRIQKGMQTGRFYAYTQFKQQQLLSRLKRCSFQLKHLGAGVAVVAALGMATPVVGQTYDFIERTGAANPFNTFPVSNGYPEAVKTVFVDIDNDGDQDLFYLSSGYNGTGGSVTYINSYYQNLGDSSSPNFVLQQASNNPLAALTENRDIAFVDIDNDGDFDVFSSNSPYNESAKCTYYENIGSSTVPSFTERTGALNPLDIVPTHLNALGFSHDLGGLPSFVDIDNDGDQDCFIAVYNYNGLWTASPSNKIWYYENTGTSTNPIFQRSTNTNNPIANILLEPEYSSNTTRVKFGVQFIDGDTDGDQDMIVSLLGGPTAIYHRNDGNATTANMQIMNAFTPIDSIPTTLYGSHINLIDIDGDLDFDAVLTGGNNLPIRYWENTTPVGINKINESTEKIGLYPNPTNGNITLDREITGQLNVFNVTGQKVYTKELELANTVNLSSLEEGTYLLSIQEGAKHLQQTIIIQK